jgi:hypothetical protein
MRRRRPWGCDQFPVDDLSDQDVWDLEEILVGRLASCGVHDGDCTTTPL